MLNGLLDFLFPPRCTGCQHTRGAWLCTGCITRIQAAYQAAPHCARCDRVVTGQPCVFCRHDTSPLLRIRILGSYSDPLKTVIRELKFGDRPQVARPLGELLAGAWQGERPQAIVTIPMPMDRQRQRGYNPAERIALACAHILHVPCWPQAIYRTRAAPQQHGLGAAERVANVTGLFACTPSYAARLHGQTIMIIDDVTTTGATLTAIACLLASQGAGHLYAMALASPSL